MHKDKAHERFKAIVDKLREKHFRITPQRVAVIKVLTGAKCHYTIEQIYEGVKADFPMISLATIYKTLNLLKSLGEALELGIADGSTHYDVMNPFPHPHMICIKCRDIIDSDVADLSTMSKEAAQKTDYQIVNNRLDFYGICPLCQKNK